MFTLEEIDRRLDKLRLELVGCNFYEELTIIDKINKLLDRRFELMNK